MHALASHSTQKDPFKHQLHICTYYLLFMLAIFSACRIFILFFIADWQNTSTNDISAVIITGLRFDLKIAATSLIVLILLPMLLMSLFNRWHGLIKFSRYSLLALLLLFIFFSFLDIGFYLFFGTAISNLIFGIVNDGTSAVLISIFSDWRLNLIIAFALICSVLISIVFLKKTLPTGPTSRSSVNKLIIWLICIVMLVICALFGRGTLDTFPLSRRTTVINDNPVINSLAQNGPYHFYYAHKDFKKDSFSSLSTRKLLEKAKFSSLSELKAAAGFDATHPLKAHTSLKKASFKQPNVIFVLMEGWSSQIASAHSEDNQVLGESAKHFASDYSFKRIFSDKYGTNPTIESLLLNAPIGPITQSAANTHQFAMSNVLPFKRQGYSSLFLSGGNSSWRKHGQFWPKQGFDQYIGRATIEKYFNEVSDNPWGVYDSLLFKYLQQQLIDKKPDKPLFSFVLTTNNHAPIRLPSTYKAPPLNPQKYGFAKDDAKALESLTGYHFQSNAFGHFLTWLKQSPYADNTIVVATGDHVLKGFANYSSANQAYNRYAVATYLYVPPAYDQLKKSDQLMAGSHKDLFPTLFELSLNNAQYYSFGTPLMNKEVTTAYGRVDQGGVIFNSGVAMNDEQQLLFKKQTATDIGTIKAPLNQQQIRLIKQQYAKDTLKKYLLVDDAKK